MFGIKSINLYI